LRSVFTLSDVQAVRDEMIKRLTELREVAETISGIISTGTSESHLHYSNTKEPAHSDLGYGCLTASL
tara:strand:+ start:227 stop:427 length:201 start_codon:yes stop_codon:yes gene_type:complete